MAAKVLLCRDIPTTLLDDAERNGKIELIRRPQDERDSPASRQWILDNLRGKDNNVQAVVCTLTEKIDEEVLEAAKSVQIISTMSVGTDHIDVQGVRMRNIKLGSTPEVLDQAVAELTLLLVLGITRNVQSASRVVSEGRWNQHPWSPLAFCGPSLQGKTIGFVGFGNIAQSVAALLPVFGPSKILYTTSKPKPFHVQHDDFARLRQRNFPLDGSVQIENEPELLQLAQRSDVVIVLTSLNASTKHLIGKEFFNKMKNTAFLINTSRGPVVDTNALIEALRKQAICGAGLDVLEGEPNVEKTHALLQDERCRDRVLLLPHIGSATIEARKAMADLTARHVLQHFNVM